MVIVHYAGITNNNASGVSVVVPEIVNNMGKFEKVALYNYSNENVYIDKPALQISSSEYSDDYHTFPAPFSKPDIVVFHSPFGIPKMKRVVDQLISEKIPYIIVPHGCFSRPAMKKKRLKKWLAIKFHFNRALENANAIQYLCENEKKDSIFNLPYIIVSNGINSTPKIEREYNKINKITFIGRKDLYHKGIDMLIEGCSLIRNELKEECIEINLYGPGTNKQNADIDQLIKKYELESIVKNNPGIFGEEKKRVLIDSDVFALTSRYEGQPIAILEAFSYALPVLVTPGTGFSEEVKRNKCGIVTELSAKAIAEGILSITKDSFFLREASQNAYNYVTSEYGWKSVTQRALNAYKGVCDEKNSRL